MPLVSDRGGRITEFLLVPWVLRKNHKLWNDEIFLALTTVADHDAKTYYFDSAVSPNVFWGDLNKVDRKPRGKSDEPQDLKGQTARRRSFFRNESGRAF